jgi:UDP-N-acetylglucosamine diphosphorylase/glucosamine-1-phosphate N-acetyltransferase
MKAVILAAGEGVRLLPITASRPKHLISVGGKPILNHCVEALKTCGVKEILIVTHYMADAIREYFGDGTDFGLKIQYTKQKAVLGTGNALSAAECYVKDDFVLVYGDLLFSSDSIRAIMDTFRAEKPSAVMGVVEVERPESYGIVKFEGQNKVKRIVEKPQIQNAPSNLANAGLYVFSKDIFEALKSIKKSVRGEWELTDAIAALIESGKTVLAEKLSKEDWFDIGRPWDLLEANSWALKRMAHKVLGNVEEGAHLFGSVTVAKTARVRSGAYVEGPCFIDEGADVGPNCFIRPCTSVGKNARIGNACEVKNSIIMNGTHIGHLSYVGDSVLGENCNLGAGTITANLRLDNDTVKMVIKEQIVDTGRRKLGAILGDNVKTGINASLMPGVKVGAGSWIGPGFMVETDIAPNTIALLKQNGDKRERKC